MQFWLVQNMGVLRKSVSWVLPKLVKSNAWKRRKYVLKITSYAFNHVHGWRTQATLDQFYILEVSNCRNDHIWSVFEFQKICIFQTPNIQRILNYNIRELSSNEHGLVWILVQLINLQISTWLNKSNIVFKFVSGW